MPFPFPQLTWDQVSIPFSYSFSDVDPLRTISLPPAREKLKTLYQRKICFAFELSSAHFNNPEIHILNVQKVWIETKRQSNVKAASDLPSKGLVDDIIM